MTYNMTRLEEYQPFSSVEEMDSTVRRFNGQLKKPHYETLNLLKQYSLKVIGVSHLKIETIARRLGRSISTIKRHLSYLKQHGFISIFNTSREKMGGKGANIYVINTYEYHLEIKNELSKMSYRERIKKDGQTLARQAMTFVRLKKETINSLNLFKRFICTGRRKNITLRQIENLKTFRTCPESVPLDIYRFNAPFFSDQQIETMYHIIMKNINRHESLSQEQQKEIMMTTFRSLVKALRNYHHHEGQPVNNIFGYVAVTSKRMVLKEVSSNAWRVCF